MGIVCVSRVGIRLWCCKETLCCKDIVLERDLVRNIGLYIGVVSVYSEVNQHYEL